MISGLGFFEILVVLLIVLMFFGSKELPHFVKESARMIAKLRRYSDKVRRELNEVTRAANIADAVSYDNDIKQRKEKVRTACLTKRRDISDGEREEKSAAIAGFLFDTEEFNRAQVIMLYAATKTEVQTAACIQAILSKGKRVVLPYCKPNSTEMGIAEIKDLQEDLQEGQYRIMEPKDNLKDNFLKSDIQLMVCPCVACDQHGARLGRGKGCYDYFLKELKTKVPLFAFAFTCQVVDEDLPFDYHDIVMDAVITEEGVKRFQG